MNALWTAWNMPDFFTSGHYYILLGDKHPKKSQPLGVEGGESELKAGGGAKVPILLSRL